MKIEYDVEGFDTIEARVRATQEDVRGNIIQAINGALQAGRAVMEAQVPRGGTNRIADSIEIEEGIVFRPGGPGGGGFWEGSLSVGENVRYFPLVTEGTGFYGPQRRGIFAPRTVSSRRSPWYVAKGKKRMHFYWRKRGRFVFMKAVRGQPPQTKWMLNSKIAVRRSLSARLAAIKLR